MHRDAYAHIILVELPLTVMLPRGSCTADHLHGYVTCVQAGNSVLSSRSGKDPLSYLMVAVVPDDCFQKGDLGPRTQIAHSALRWSP